MKEENQRNEKNSNSEGVHTRISVVLDEAVIKLMFIN